MSSALQGLRVIDFGQYVAGPMTAQLLADHGAGVIRVDPPGGPVWGGAANAVLQRGKRSIVLDLKEPADHAIAVRLVESADVIVENFRPGVMDRLGLGAAEMTARNPRLVYLSLPGFAADDPRAEGYTKEGVVGAAAGLYQPLDFEAEGDPIYNTVPIASVLAAVGGLNAVLAALIARHRTGWGQRIEVPLFDAAFEVVRFYGDRVPEKEFPPGQMLGGNADGPLTGHYRCSDGRWVQLSWLEGRQYESFLRRQGLYEDWAEKGLLATERTRFGVDPGFAETVYQRLAEVFATRPAAQWESELNPECDLAPCQTAEEWLLYDEQARAVDAVINLTDAYLGATHQVGYAVTMSATPPAAQGGRRLLDGDRAEVLAELDDAVAVQRSAAPTGEPVALGAALEGMLAVDTTQLLAGPSACRTLAEFGAEVVHVSNPSARGTRGYHYMTDSGKKSMLLDLKRPGAHDVFWCLVSRADVLCTNYSAAVAHRLGVDEETVRGHRADIVYGRISAHGHVGPRADYRGHEMVGQAVTGMQTRYGQDYIRPFAQPFALSDSGAGLLAAAAMLVALYHRLQTGNGQFVGTSLAQSASLFSTPYLVAHRDQDWQHPGGLRCRGLGTFERMYRASDRWLFLALPDDDAARRLAAVPGFDGIETTERLEEVIADRIRGESADIWQARLGAAGVTSHRVNTIEEAMNDSWARSHHVVTDVEFLHGVPGRLVGPSPRLARTPTRRLPPAPPIGWDGPEILAEIGLGDRLGPLIAAGALVVAPERGRADEKSEASTCRS